MDKLSYPIASAPARTKPAETKSGALSLWLDMRLLRYLLPYRKQFLAALLFMVLFGASDGVVPLFVKYALDKVFAEGNFAALYLLPVALIVFTIVRAGLDFAQQFLMARIGHMVVRDIRNQVNRHLLGLSADFFAFRSSADLVSRVTSDVLLVRTLLTEAMVAVIRDLIRVLALLGAAVYLDPLLAVVAALVFPLGVIPIQRFGKKMRKLSRVGQEAVGRLSALMQESVLGQRVVKIFGREEHEQQCFERENQELTKTFIKAERIKALIGPLNEVLASLAISGVILYGAYAVTHELRSQGEFIAFLLAVFLMYDPFKKLSRVSSVLQQGSAGAERIFEVLQARSSVTEKPNPRHLTAANSIEFEKVSFSYRSKQDAEQVALKDIDLFIKEGSKVALVGFSGSGKSTLVDLIARFIDPQSGAVKIGGVDISSVRLSELRSRIAMVGQHTFLFHDSVCNNIAYGREGATREEIEAVAKAANAYDFIMHMPQGFETVMGEAGLTLSGGERQRIAIARALLKDAPILILDEATAALDNRSEREVQDALRRLEKGRTTIVIAHRLSSVKDADMIVVLKNGQVVESGVQQELLELNGEFAKLYRLQFQDIPAFNSIQ